MSEKDKNEELLSLVRRIEHDTHQIGIVALIAAILMVLGFIGAVIAAVAASGLTEPNQNKTKSSSSNYSSIFD